MRIRVNVFTLSASTIIYLSGHSITLDFASAVLPRSLAFHSTLSPMSHGTDMQGHCRRRATKLVYPSRNLATVTETHLNPLNARHLFCRVTCNNCVV